METPPAGPRILVTQSCSRCSVIASPSQPSSTRLSLACHDLTEVRPQLWPQDLLWNPQPGTDKPGLGQPCPQGRLSTKTPPMHTLPRSPLREAFEVPP